MIETSWLRAFASFAEDANLSRAARRLHLSQPAIHAQLRRLSEELGATLYRRVGRGLVLTDAGKEVLAFARDVEERTQNLAAHLRGEGGPDRVVLAAGPGSLLYVIGDGLRAYAKRRAPRLDLLTLDAAAAFDAVRSGAAHVGVAASDAPPTDLEVHALTRVEQVLVVPRAHALASRRRVTLDRLANERLVLPPEGRPHRAMIDAALRSRELRIEIGAVAQGWELTMRLVELGFGMAIVNGCCRIPRGLVARRLPELPTVAYVAFTRARPGDAAKGLVRTLVEHGDDWRSESPAR